MTTSSTLHILSRLHDGHLPAALRRSLGSDDGLLLSGDAVYAALSAQEELPEACHALESAVRARGLLSRWPQNIPLIDHGGFVDLCVQYQKSLSWS